MKLSSGGVSSLMRLKHNCDSGVGPTYADCAAKSSAIFCHRRHQPRRPTLIGEVRSMALTAFRVNYWQDVIFWTAEGSAFLLSGSCKPMCLGWVVEPSLLPGEGLL